MSRDDAVDWQLPDNFWGGFARIGAHVRAARAWSLCSGVAPALECCLGSPRRVTAATANCTAGVAVTRATVLDPVLNVTMSPAL
jgi:hypothetical protein